MPFLKNSDGEHFSDDNYHNVLKPYLVEEIVNGKFLPHHAPFQEFLKTISPDLLRSYLLNEDVHLKAGTHIKNILAVLREELTIVFPLTAKKHLYSHYGPHQGNQPWAIPYQLGKPSINSEFGTELEVLNYSLQMYLEMGVPRSIIKQEVKRIQEFSFDEEAQKKPQRQLNSFLMAPTCNFRN